MDSFKHLQRGGNVLTICFTGFIDIDSMTQQNRDDRFEWNVSNITQSDVLWVRDDKGRWYLCGIDGIASTVTELAGWLDRIASDYDRIETIGSSMGGFAALLYGMLLSHNHQVITRTFSPQTNLAATLTNSSSWISNELEPRVIKHIHEDDTKYMDVTTLKYDKFDGQLFCGKYHRYDMTQAEGIRHAVKVKTFDTNEHNVALYLKQHNLLEDALLGKLQ